MWRKLYEGLEFTGHLWSDTEADQLFNADEEAMDTEEAPAPAEPAPGDATPSSPIDPTDEELTRAFEEKLRMRQERFGGPHRQISQRQPPPLRHKLRVTSPAHLWV